MIRKIKKIEFAVLITVVGALMVNAQNATMWKLDKSHTSVNFSINHFFSAVTGKFTSFEGNFNFDPAILQGSKADFTIVVKSVNTDDNKRDNHLQSSDFFNAKTFPNMTFVSSKIEKKSDKEYLVYGKLIIKDKTKDIVLLFKVTGEMEHPMIKGTVILGLVSNLVINGNDYGMWTGDWAAKMVVGDEVNININIELNCKK